MTLRASLSRVGTRLDIVAASLAAAYGLYRLADMLPERSPNPLVIAILLASLAYLALRNRLTDKRLERRDSSRATFLISDALYFVALSVALLTWHRSLYVLPLLHFVATTLAAGTVVWDVASGRDGLGGIAAMLGKVVILGVLVRAVAFYQFPGPIGSDPWRHVLTVETIAASGHVPSLLSDALGTFNLYVSMPLFHILATAAGAVAGVSMKSASFIAGSLAQVLSCVSVFLLGRSLRGTGTGALAALLYCMADYSILWGVQVIAMTLASAIVACVLWLLLSGRPASPSNAAVALLLLIALVLCHTVSAFVVLVTLVVVAMGIRVARLIGLHSVNEALTPLLSPRLVAAYGVTMLIWWMVMPTSSGDSFFALQVDKLAQLLGVAAESDTVPIASAVARPYAQLLHDMAGSAILTGLGLFAALAALNPGGRRGGLVVLAIAAGAVVALRAVGSGSLQQAMISSRWMVFIFMLFSVLSAWVLSLLLARGHQSLGRLAFTAALCAFYFFPMATGSVANQSSPFWPTTMPRTGYTVSEQTAWQTQLNRLRVSPVSDGYYVGAMGTLTTGTQYELVSARDAELFIVRGNYIGRPDLNVFFWSVVGDMRDVHVGFYRHDGQPIAIVAYADGLARTGGTVYASDGVRMVQTTA